VSHTDAAFMSTFKGVMIFLVALFVVILVLAQVVSGIFEQEASDDPVKARAVEERIAPIGQVRVAGEAREEPQKAEAPAEPKSGEQVVQQACFACHGTGAAGAPKIGDTAAWQSRADQGMATLLDHAVNGFKAMPPKGGAMDLSEEEVQRAIVHMLSATGIELEGAGSAGETAARGEEPPAAEAQEAAGEQQAVPAPAGERTGGEAAAGADAAAGKGIYGKACIACHGMGVAGAPKLGDKAAWSPRIAKGMDTLYQHAIGGFQGGSGVMPPKGGATFLSDQEVRNAVAYMAQQSQ
jgi:cytochrome c5